MPPGAFTSNPEIRATSAQIDTKAEGKFPKSQCNGVLKLHRVYKGAQSRRLTAHPVDVKSNFHTVSTV